MSYRLNIAARGRLFDDPVAIHGYRVVGGAKSIPGYASEASAKIAVRKTPAWANAVIEPFSYHDGSIFFKTETRYAIVIRVAL